MTEQTPAPVSGETSDGYHTFNELYDHRRALTAALGSFIAQGTRDAWAWRSRKHHPDGDPIFEGYFIVGIDLPTGTVTYHYEDQYWDDFANFEELKHAPLWDGALPATSVTRLIEFARREA